MQKRRLFWSLRLKVAIKSISVFRRRLLIRNRLWPTIRWRRLPSVSKVESGGELAAFVPLA